MPDAPLRAIASLSLAERYVNAGIWDDFVDGCSPAELSALLYDWSLWSRPAQQPPAGAWVVWYIRAGRGFGKTRTGAETCRMMVHGRWLAEPCGRLGIVGATAADARDVMVEGESGLLAVHPPAERPDYEPSKRRLTWPNGAQATVYSADEPDRLRGPQHDFVWGDEPASWKQGREAFDNASLGLRLGDDPRMILTGTPKPALWLKEMRERPTTRLTTGAIYENITNLAPTFIAEVLGRYEGTRLGRQELYGLELDDVEGALWTERIIEAHRVTDAPAGRTNGAGLRTAIAVDPPGETAEAGIVVACAPRRAGPESHAWVLDDASMAGRPEEWGGQVVAAWRRWNADEIVVEANQGGDMVRAVIHAIEPTCPVRKIRATESKRSRAEPIATLYERGRVHHVGYFGHLESQLVTWVPSDAKSPDRLDALVHVITDLLPIATPRIAVVHSPLTSRLPGPPGRPPR